MQVVHLLIVTDFTAKRLRSAFTSVVWFGNTPNAVVLVSDGANFNLIVSVNKQSSRCWPPFIIPVTSSTLKK